jgi:CDP-diacylglycerol---serine O-phosphatidyltransferase
MSLTERLQNPGLKRGAALLPSLFTIGNLFLGFSAIIHALRLDFETAAQLLVIAVIFDMLDGRIARLTGTTSEFGAQLDSLSDIVSFGVAPAVIAYQWGLATLHRSFLAAFFFVMCAAIRLARFNVQRKVVDGRYFVGLPSPAAAGFIISIVYFHPEPLYDRSGAAFTMAILVIAAFLMVSTLRYWSFKTLDLRSRRSYFSMVGLAAILALIATEPSWALLAWSCGYASSGPVAYVVGLVRRKGDGGGATSTDPSAAPPSTEPATSPAS